MAAVREIVRASQKRLPVRTRSTASLECFNKWDAVERVLTGEKWDAVERVLTGEKWDAVERTVERVLTGEDTGLFGN